MTDSRSLPVRHAAPLRVFATLVVGLACVWFAGFIAFVAGIKDDPAPFDAPADGIVVLTGGSDRLAVGLDLLKRGQAERLLISGVHESTAAADLSDNAVGTAELFDCCIDLGRAARDTRGNASEAAKWAADHSYKRLIIVTADYHMPRTLIEFRGAMPGIQLIPYPVRPHDIHLPDWWRYPGTTKLLAGEYSKYLVAFGLHAVSPRHGGSVRAR
jgi:uncharacterized SAM-binding protein YcdF (DUF218 family)